MIEKKTNTKIGTKMKIGTKTKIKTRTKTKKEVDYFQYNPNFKSHLSCNYNQFINLKKPIV